MSKRAKIKTFLILSLFVFGLGLMLFGHKKTVADNSQIIRGAIIPHHLVAQAFMADLGSRLAGSNIPRLVIIGPNHNEVGNGHLLTDDESLIDSNQEVLKTDVVNVNKDHACYAPRSVLEKYLTKTKISCVLVSNRVSQLEISAVAELLKKDLGDDGVLVASVDFSHYLPLRSANENDQTTWDYIKKFDTPALLKLKNGYLDSPKTLAVLFEYLHLINATNFSQIKHSNSAQILKTLDTPSTTSYFEIVYW